MKLFSYVLLTAGVLLMVGGPFIFGHIDTVNAVDSHVWGISLNGIKSFPWPVFTGFVFFILGVVFYMSTLKRYNVYGQQLT